MVKKTLRKRSLGRPSIKVDLKKTEYEDGRRMEMAKGLSSGDLWHQKY
jgi:hypothetical protein